MSPQNKKELINKARILSLKYGESFIVKCGKLTYVTLNPVSSEIVKVLFINGEMLAA